MYIREFKKEDLNNKRYYKCNIIIRTIIKTSAIYINLYFLSYYNIIQNSYTK